MAEALVSLLIEQLASVTLTQMEEKVRLIVGVDREIGNLIFHLHGIQAVLQDAEERQVKEANVKFWLDNLKDMSYDISDVLGEWSTEIMKRKTLKQLKQQQKRQGEIIANRSKVRCSFTISMPSLSCFRQSSGVFMRHDIGSRIRDINERLTLIASLRQAYRFKDTHRSPEQLERPKTSPFFVDVAHIVGRDKEKKDLIDKLLCESSGSSSQQGGKPIVIPIVGMGGTGKTTFALFVYNDEKVSNHFIKKIWFCVSEPFEEIKVAKSILASLIGNENDERLASNDVNKILQHIDELVAGIRFLLVLDDVWNPHVDQWKKLERALEKGASGSRIIVTTRIYKVVTTTGASPNNVIQLNRLSEEDCWSVFYHIAFHNKDKCVEFESNMGREIAKRCNGCNGSPLVAKTLGGLMLYKNTTEWQDVLDSKIWELEEFEQQVFQPLLLSYYDLNPSIRRCFLYCASFPKDYEFDKNKLIEMWMSQEYLGLKGDKAKERDIGESYFNTLVMRSFFQDLKKDDQGHVISCKMHDIVHDFVQYLTKDEYIIMEMNNNLDEINNLTYGKVRHMRLILSSETSRRELVNFFLCTVHKCKKLRTFIADAGTSSVYDLNITTPGIINNILQLKCLRTLSLRWWCGKYLPKEIGGLIHIRYLDLSYNPSLRVLPASVGDLHNLQTLRLTRCTNLKSLPKTMYKLINLKHIYVGGCFELSLPEGIGRLTSLQILDEIRILPGKSRFKLGNLRHLNELRGSLDIVGLGHITDASEATEAEMVKKKHLSHLRLCFPDYVSRMPMDGSATHEDILRSLQPHTNLVSLSIGDYQSTTINIDWMSSLHNLKELRMTSCNNSSLPPLGKLPSLESLELYVLSELKKVEVGFLGFGELSQTSSSSNIAFPKLQRLEFNYLVNWETWEGVAEQNDLGVTIMPCLSYLSITGCNNLERLPDMLWKTPLQTLIIDECEKLIKEELIEVSGNIANVQINDSWVKKEGVYTDPVFKKQ